MGQVTSPKRKFEDWLDNMALADALDHCGTTTEGWSNSEIVKRMDPYAFGRGYRDYEELLPVCVGCSCMFEDTQDGTETRIGWMCAECHAEWKEPEPSSPIDIDDTLYQEHKEQEMGI